MVEAMSRLCRFSPEMREGAVRMLFEQKPSRRLGSGSLTRSCRFRRVTNKIHRCSCALVARRQCLTETGTMYWGQRIGDSIRHRRFPDAGLITVAGPFAARRSKDCQTAT